jgi:hypothetical protein
MNALFASEAKRFLLGLKGAESSVGLVRLLGFAGLFDTGVEGSFESVAQAPDRDVVEVQAVRPACFQGFDAEVLLGDLRQELIDLAHVRVLRCD